MHTAIAAVEQLHDNNFFMGFFQTHDAIFKFLNKKDTLDKELIIKLYQPLGIYGEYQVADIFSQEAFLVQPPYFKGPERFYLAASQRHRQINIFDNIDHLHEWLALQYCLYDIKYFQAQKGFYKLTTTL